MCDYIFSVGIEDVLQVKEETNSKTKENRFKLNREIRDLLYQEEKVGNILPNERSLMELYLDDPAMILKEEAFFQMFLQYQDNEKLANCFTFLLALATCEQVKSLFTDKERFAFKEYSLSGKNYYLGTIYFKSGKKHIPLLLYQFKCKHHKWTIEFNFFDFSSAVKQNITAAELQDLGASIKTINTVSINDFLAIQHLQQKIVDSFQSLIFPNLFIKKGQIQNRVSYGIIKEFKDAKTRSAMKKELEERKNILLNQEFLFMFGYVYHINPKRIYKRFQEI